MASFSNPQVHTEDLPKYEALSFASLERDYLKVLTWGGLLFMVINIAVPIGLLSGFKKWNDNTLVIAVFGAWFLLNILNLFLMRLRFERMGYAIRENDIVYKKGLITSHTTTVPFNRVQHCDIKQGLIERYIDLSRINVYTAGGGASDLSIPGLKPDAAHKIMEFVLKKANIDEEEE